MHASCTRVILNQSITDDSQVCNSHTSRRIVLRVNAKLEPLARKQNKWRVHLNAISRADLMRFALHAPHRQNIDVGRRRSPAAAFEHHTGDIYMRGWIEDARFADFAAIIFDVVSESELMWPLTASGHGREN